MSNSTKNAIKQDSLKQLSALLTENPNVLADHPELFELITLNEQRFDNVESLAQRQLTVLKQRIDVNNRGMLKLISNAKHNEFITNKLFDITYELTACVDLADIFDVLYQDIIPAFSVDAVGIRLSMNVPSLKELSEIDPLLVQNDAYQAVLREMQNGSSCYGDQFSHEVLSLFFGPNAESTLSAAFVPLIMPNETNSLGVLALASYDKDKFSSQSTHGTLHLDRLGKIVAIAVERASRDIVVMDA